MTTIQLRYVTFLVLAACAASQHSSAVAGPKPRCGPGGPPGAKCGPPGPPPTTTQAPPPPTLTSLVDPSVHTVVSTTIDGTLVRAVAGRGAQGAFVTIEKVDNGRIVERTPILFSGVRYTAPLDVFQLAWRTDRPGDVVFHLGENHGEWICHLEQGATSASCVIARGGGRPRR